MKKQYFLSTAAFFVTLFGSMQAQVVNGNFENIKPNNLVSNWGMNFIMPLAFDLETNQSTGDTILFGGCMPAFVYGTMDSHRGNYAMQITNGLNLTQNKVISAEATIFSDPEQDSPGWNAGVPIVEGQLPVTMLGFYYKFFPMGSDDVAQAELVVLDTEGVVLGKATANITEATSNYEYLYAPVQFTSQGTPGFMHITFSMEKKGSTPSFGSSLVIDDVFINFSSLSNNSDFKSSNFGVYPTVADHEINIVKGTALAGGNYDFTITNAEGKMIKHQSVQLIDNTPSSIDVSQLANGIYYISSKDYTTKFIKK